MKFLANTPNRLAVPYPYATFKALINDICQERLRYSSELSGFLLPPMPLDEFLCVYFLKKHQLRRLAELKLKEFLSSLKLYMGKWHRAKLFANVCGIAGDLLNNKDYLLADYHTQMYYVYCMNVLTEPTHIWESGEGHTWLRSDREEFISSLLLPWVKKNEFRKKRIEMGYLSKSLTDPNNQFGTFYDVDLLINYLVKDFNSARQRANERVLKTFIKRNQLQHGLFSFDEFRNLLEIPKKTRFPGDYTVARALYFALLSQQNGFEVTGPSVIAACIRYGITNPAPLVQLTFDDVLPYNSLKLAFDKKDDRFTSVLNKLRIQRDESPAKAKALTPQQLVKAEIEENSYLGSVPSIEKIAGLLAQHYSIIRELKKYADQFKDMVDARVGADEIVPAFEGFSVILHNACEFFTFPLAF